MLVLRCALVAALLAAAAAAWQENVRPKVFAQLVAPGTVRSITIASNGNSPENKMLGGMMVDVQQGFVPMIPEAAPAAESLKKRSNYDESRKINNNSTKLAINERYRRLIPYITFYYANDLAIPTTERIRTVEVEKAQIFEAQELANQRQAKKIIFPENNIPRYQGNRLTQYNIASANPSKIYYKNGIPFYRISSESSQPTFSDIPDYYYDGRITQKLSTQPFAFTSTHKPFLNLYNEESPNIRYYLSEREQSPKYKLVPYDQTPPIAVPYAQNPVNVPLERKPTKLTYQQPSPVKIPVKVAYQQTNPIKAHYEQSPIKLSYENTPIKLQYEQKKPQNNVYPSRKPVIMSVLVPKELYVKPRPVRPPFIYDSGNVPVRKQPTIVSESYYEKHRPAVLSEPVIESGFKPIVNVASYTTEPSIQTSTLSVPHSTTPTYEPSPVKSVSDKQPNYYHYVVDQPKPEPTKPTPVSSVTLGTLLNTLQMNKSIPKPITTENVSSSIRTLLQVLNTLKTTPSPKVELVPISTPKPFAASKVIANESPIVTHLRPEIIKTGLQEEHLIPVSTPSQHLDDEQSTGGGTSIRYPLPVSSDDEGGTPGRPGVDYPVLSTIPHTAFDCKTQRYKGFFADTETRCQVWHYCDLNGGQASFLCPNGTIFSQAGLTCDWWFNVRCDSTTQLYVLNESLYKFILPQVPKFPEDYSGPLVDKYLMLKFKEMEEEFKKNKNKHVEDNSSEEDTESSTETAGDEMDKRQLGELSAASVIVESPGYSGKVERLSDD